MKRIAVVILNWNGKNLLQDFLPYVVKYSPEAAIYVADNASTDDSVSFLKANYPDIKIIENKQNYGYAGGYNAALKEVKEDIYVLLNSDVEVTENWLTPVLQLFDSEPNTTFIQPKILDYYNKNHFEYAGAAGGYIDKYGIPFCRGRILNTIEEDNGQYNDNAEIFWASGACLFVRRDVFWELNGFDEDFFAHQEEIDLCWRAFNKGYTAKFCSQSIIYHVGGATLQTNNPRKTFLNFRNSLWMMLKNLPANKLFPVLFVRLAMDGAAGMHYLLKGQVLHLWALLKAHYYFYLKLPYFLKKRYKKQNKCYYKTNSIIWRYYMLNKKKFVDNFNNSL
ncbi:glycosyl transferase family 2 [Flavobacterium suaedae]|uniref:Glycosyl transferase family 2 n=1 Tax=Flavobacterium suaedae TaxID=1767027 RepID=A0ABQ1JDW5_9FLAO|nr:glycosyltransferase family 2 protein [Flavobacterium suaedae]GGB66071.1 glycosyl transferase family 2 [Flavobacterium suaedae]